MTIKETLDKYPNVKEELKKFFLQKLEESIKENKDIPQSFKDRLHKESLNDETLLNHLESNPRLICDFMDDRNVFISIMCIEQGLFTYTINEETSKIVYNSRKYAEIQSVARSIEIYSTIKKE